MRKILLYTFIWVTLYAIAMAFLESAVVVYIREIFYPDGFSFPLKDIGNHLAATEFIREAATLLMLVAIGMLAGTTRNARFAWFIYSFAVWDIFYYVFLKALLNWPASLLEWDVLFLIPVTWVGPVIAPVICSLLMIILALAMLCIELRNGRVQAGKTVWSLLISGSLIVIISFTMDFVNFMHGYFSWSEILAFRWMAEITKLSELYVPQHFNWWVFLAGIAVISAGIVLFIRNSVKKTVSSAQ